MKKQPFIESIKSKIEPSRYGKDISPKITYTIKDLEDYANKFEKQKELILKSEFRVSIILPDFLKDDTVEEIKILAKRDLVERMEDYFYGDIKHKLREIYSQARIENREYNSMLLAMITELIESLE